jgi:hypothetical protein
MTFVAQAICVETASQATRAAHPSAVRSHHDAGIVAASVQLSGPFAGGTHLPDGGSVIRKRSPGGGGREL